MNEIRHGVDGWDLVEFSRQMPNGKNPQVIEKFVYELHHPKAHPTPRERERPPLT